MRTRRELLLLPFAQLLLARENEYRKALPGYRMTFPRDYFDHPEFRTEWWYFTGNLRTTQGRRFGYELTFFRHGASATPREREHVWDVDNVWLAHFALSDIEAAKFHHSERLNRTGPGLAGVDRSRGLIWNGNWRVEWRSDGQRLFAMAEGFRVDLQMRSEKPPVVHGSNGLSQKSAGAGRASHYVSLTRLATRGSITVAGRNFAVDGLSWMDHEFFTHSLEANQSGWDWFSIQFTDGTELMLYRLRRKDGSVEPYSSGTFVAEDGATRHIAYDEYLLEPSQDPRDHWSSPRSKGRYPLRWRLRVPALGIDAVATTPLREQELIGTSGASPSYWEGAIDVRGSRNGQPLTGTGYLEMTGYSGAVRLQ